MPDVHRIYDPFATAFDKDRSRSLMERNCLREVTCRLRQAAHIFDLGCGSGDPIARFFIEEGFQISGIDAAPVMVELCRDRFPEMT